MSAGRSEVDPKWERGEIALRDVGYVTLRPFEREVRQLFLSRVFVSAAAMLVIGTYRRIVVSRDALDVRFTQPCHGLVRPWRVPYEVTEVVRSDNVRSTDDIIEHGFERGQIRVDIRDQSVAHVASNGSRFMARRSSADAAGCGDLRDGIPNPAQLLLDDITLQALERNRQHEVYPSHQVVQRLTKRTVACDRLLDCRWIRHAPMRE